MKLELQLVPKSSWYTNLRTAMGLHWTQLSRQIRNGADCTCKYCGWKETYETRENWEYTHLHELWEFKAETGIQKLIGFECVCPDCHMIHHWGLAEVKGLDLNKLLEHACKVNGCTKEEFKKHISDSFEEWQRRSERKWQVDLGEWKHLVGDANGQDGNGSNTRAPGKVYRSRQA